MALERTLDLLPEVREFLSAAPLGGVIGGQTAVSAEEHRFVTRDPGSGDVIAEVCGLQADDVDRAVRAAGRAFAESGWASLAPAERAAWLHRLADAVESRKPILAQIEALDCGKLYPQAAGDVQNFVDTMRYFADMAQHVQQRSVLAVARHEAWTSRHPWGPCGFIFPWNFPILLAGWGIAPALAAGNTVVIKPAEDTPLSTIFLGRLASEIGLPDGVINVVPGLGEPTGAALASHPGLRRMSFTGSPEVGRLVAEACGRNLVPVKLELGGKGAAVVFEDTELASTVEKLVQAITFHTGQVCCDATRWLIHQPIYERFVAATSNG
jgi:acyl-CoA reductase-like NAD-dependent aldehyde dehydrogenase